MSLIYINEVSGCWITSPKNPKYLVREALLGKKFSMKGLKCRIDKNCVHPLHNKETARTPGVSGV